MPLYVAAGQVFSSHNDAIAAAGDSEVRSFNDYFEAEAFASGNSLGSSATAASPAPEPKKHPHELSTNSMHGASPTVTPARNGAVARTPSRNESTQSGVKRARYGLTQPRILYSEKTVGIRASLKRWKPHPQFAHRLPLPAAETPGGKDSGPVHDELQEAAVRAAHKGESFLLTGSAGVGKSYVLKRVIRELREKGKRVMVTASTGCAAVGIQGNTLHSALRLGIGKDSVNSLITKMRSKRNQSVRQELMQMHTLVIDEISMIDVNLFNMADAVVRAARCSSKLHAVNCMRCKPFGGAQVILCGDFFQLPPIVERGMPNVKMFCFESAVFKKKVGNNVYRLTRVHRQDEREFVGLLNELRVGVVTTSSQVVLDACRIPLGVPYEEYDNRGQRVVFTKIYPFREQVRSENWRELQKQRTQAVMYEWWVQKTPGSNRTMIEGGLKNLRVDQRIELRVGARVLCLKNIAVGQGICNGSAGRIIGFYPARLTERECAALAAGRFNEVYVSASDGFEGAIEKMRTGHREKSEKINTSPGASPLSKFSARARVRNVENTAHESVHPSPLSTFSGQARVRKVENTAAESAHPSPLSTFSGKARVRKVENTAPESVPSVARKLGEEEDGMVDVSEMQVNIENGVVKKVKVNKRMKIGNAMKAEKIEVEPCAKAEESKDEKAKAQEHPVQVAKVLLEKAPKDPQRGIPLMNMYSPVVPVVEFDNGLRRRITPEVWEIAQANGKVQARVYQLPLCLGYALSVHKSQGMTLSRVQADVGRSFDKGQVYVALSRVSTIEGLRLSSFDARKVMVHESVVQFEKNLDVIAKKA